MNKKLDKKLDKNALQSRRNLPKLTEKQAEVLSLILNEFLNPTSISSRLQTSRQNVYQIIAKIRKKGYLSTQNFNALQKSTHVKQLSSVWRYHNLHFLITPFYLFPRYHKYRLDSGNYGIQFGDWVFKLHKNKVEVQSKSLVDFVDADKFKAIGKAERSFNKALVQAGNRFGFMVYKEGKANILLKRNDLAFGESDFAKGAKENYLRVKGEDGRTWFMIDRSKGFVEHEYVREVVPDSEALEPYLNSIREKPHYLPHELKAIVDTVIGVQAEYALQIKKHLEVQDRTLRTMDEMSRTMREIRNSLKK